MKKEIDWWWWAVIVVFAALAIMSICSCSDLLQAGGHVLNATGDTIVFVGEHLTETGQ